MRFAYISENKMYLFNDGKVSELQSQRVAHYTETVRTINKNKEWKRTGTGAHFTDAVYDASDMESTLARINWLDWDESGLLYSMELGDMGGIYRKNVDDAKAAEGHVLTKMNMSIDGISRRDGKIAAAMDGHIAVCDDRGNYDEITDGDSVESYPCWSADGRKILCSTAGIARNEYGRAAEMSPKSILSIDLEANSIDELYSDENSDCIRPQNDSEGNLYFIRQPYKVVQKKTPLWKDILLFPVRLIKALLGFLNAFSVIFGGEPLRDGGKRRSDVKTKDKSDKELFFEGRLIEAEKNEKINAGKGDKNPGIFPHERELVCLSPDGSEKIIKRGVQDFTLLEDGSIICSNGRAVIHISDGGEELLTKAKLAKSICVIGGTA